MKNFVIFTSVVLSLIEYIVSDFVEAKEGESCAFKAKCVEGTYCVFNEDKDKFGIFCRAPERRVGFECEDITSTRKNYPPCAKGLDCLDVDVLYTSEKRCFGNEAQVQAYEAAEEKKRNAPCRKNLNGECEGGYCVADARYHLHCKPPSQEGQSCEERYTAEYITKYRRYDIFYKKNAPCAEGLLCRYNKCVQDN